MNGLTAKMTTGKPSSLTIFFTESVTMKGNVGIPAFAALSRRMGVLFVSRMFSLVGMTLFPRISACSET